MDLNGEDDQRHIGRLVQRRQRNEVCDIGPAYEQNHVDIFFTELLSRHDCRIQRVDHPRFHEHGLLRA